MTMTLIGFIVLLVVAAIAGALGQAIAGYSLGGCLVSSLVGFIGAFIGLWLARELGLPELLSVTVEGETFPVIWAIVGSALLTAIIGILARRRYA
ncbi:MAG TPA: GlsB/YeaQ/YmgE family stress response membrane protein [Anaerolineales bacterium]|nr:GlsB/YeaQ/YmgE family stress response membrane protein [Anaerolineales bacterium]